MIALHLDLAAPDSKGHSPQKLLQLRETTAADFRQRRFTMPVVLYQDDTDMAAVIAPCPTCGW
jgi:hypothetical protein